MKMDPSNHRDDPCEVPIIIRCATGYHNNPTDLQRFLNGTVLAIIPPFLLAACHWSEGRSELLVHPEDNDNKQIHRDCTAYTDSSASQCIGIECIPDLKVLTF
jgi:hypothetical protein